MTEEPEDGQLRCHQIIKGGNHFRGVGSTEKIATDPLLVRHDQSIERWGNRKRRVRDGLKKPKGGAEGMEGSVGGTLPRCGTIKLTGSGACPPQTKRRDIMAPRGIKGIHPCKFRKRSGQGKLGIFITNALQTHGRFRATNARGDFFRLETA